MLATRPVSSALRLSRTNAGRIATRQAVKRGLWQVRHDHTGPGQHAHTAALKPAFSPSTYNVASDLQSANVDARLKQSILGEFSEAEQKARIELAAAYRLFAHFKWNEAIFNHFTCQVVEEDGTKHFLINPYGLRYDEVTASSLLKIDLDGNIVHPGVVGDLFGVNRAGFVIHAAIHRARGDDARAIAHNHVPSITGLACTKDGFLDNLSQTSELLGEAAYHDFEGLVTDVGEQSRLVKDVGDKDILFFRNHGVLTIGRSVGEAWLNMYNLLRAGEIQAWAQAASGGDKSKLIIPNAKVAEKTFKRSREMSVHAPGELEFAAYSRLMDKLDPSYRL